MAQMSWWETAWELRKVAEERKLLSLSSENNYDLEVVADELLHDDAVRCIVSSYIKESNNNGFCRQGISSSSGNN